MEEGLSVPLSGLPCSQSRADADRSSTRWFGGSSLWSTCAGVQERLAVVRHGPSRCLGAKDPWASSGCSVLRLCVSKGVGLDWPSPSETFWSLIGGEGGRIQGLTFKSRSP